MTAAESLIILLKLREKIAYTRRLIFWVSFPICSKTEGATAWLLSCGKKKRRKCHGHGMRSVPRVSFPNNKVVWVRCPGRAEAAWSILLGGGRGNYPRGRRYLARQCRLSSSLVIIFIKANRSDFRKDILTSLVFLCFVGISRLCYTSVIRRSETGNVCCEWGL